VVIMYGYDMGKDKNLFKLSREWKNASAPYTILVILFFFKDCF
jgi:hypothetical protein